MIEESERAWHQHRGSNTLHQPRCNQNGDGGRKRTGERRRRKESKAHHEDELRADSISRSSSRQNQCCEGNSVGADNPLQF